MRFVQAKHYKRAARTEVDLIVIHDMEYPERPTGAEWCAQFFTNPMGRDKHGNVVPVVASAHYAVDNDSIVQCVRDEDVAFHAPGANHNGIGIEHAGYAKQTRAEWLDAYSMAMLELSAELVARLCARYGIPPRKLTSAELRTGARGIVGHDDCTAAFKDGEGHHDPGPQFPWDWYIARVHAHHALLEQATVVHEAPLDWPVVEYAGARYYVAPSYIWPISIGGAEEVASAMRCELPTEGLVDAIWQAADVRLDPITRSVENGLLADWGASMRALDTISDQAQRIEQAIAGRSYRLLAGMCKDVVVRGAQVGLYGWHRRDGAPIQPFYAGHARGHMDYSQGLRLVRRI